MRILHTSRHNFLDKCQGKLGFYGSLKPLAHPKAFSAWLRTLYRHHWHVYSKRPFGGTDQALRYLGRYTHRVAISNHRMVSFADGQVTFRWKDYAHRSKQKLMTLTAEEFLRRFLLHVLPHGFVRIRFFGFLANRRRKSLLPLCRQLLQMPPRPGSVSVQPKPCSRAVWQCPRCGGLMLLTQRLTALELQSQSAQWRVHVDSS